MWMLDTNICIYIIKHRPPEVIERFRNLHVSEVAVSSVTVLELAFGVNKSRYQEKSVSALSRFLQPLVVVDFNREDGETAGALRADLERRGRPIGPYDLQIAAQALRREITLVTNNLREFERIEGLNLENWVSKD
ncbi:MAG: type II toxin-antitoxin system VapC family toxin [Pseudomonadota bacterium]|nr:type II toxin-antitoxin system VapC family toxin [Pseudomonadota bacterium]